MTHTVSVFACGRVCVGVMVNVCLLANRLGVYAICPEPFSRSHIQQDEKSAAVAQVPPVDHCVHGQHGVNKLQLGGLRQTYFNNILQRGYCRGEPWQRIKGSQYQFLIAVVKKSRLMCREDFSDAPKRPLYTNLKVLKCTVWFIFWGVIFAFIG